MRRAAIQLFVAADEEAWLETEPGGFVPGLRTKRGPDAIVLIERASRHLQWFVEYAPAPDARDAGGDRSAAA